MPRCPPLPGPWLHLFKAGLDEVGFVNEPLLEVIQALILEAHGLPARDELHLIKQTFTEYVLFFNYCAGIERNIDEKDSAIVLE